MEMNSKPIFSLLIIALFLFVGCGNEKKEYQKKQLDVTLKEYHQYNNLSIVLHDMDYDDAFNKYKHQYKIIYQPLTNSDTLISNITDWRIVSDEEFNSYVDYMGMEIASKTDGVVAKKVSPVGYNKYVGNDQYGQWRNDSSGSRFWEFYGKYRFMTSMFYLVSPIRYSYWYDYRYNYYPSGRVYYGYNNGIPIYGTRGSYYNNYNSKSRWSSKSTTFKDGVRGKVKRSAQVSKSRRTSRSRGRSNSSFRSRGGGYGK